MADPLKSILVFYDHFSPAFKAGGPVQSLVNLVGATAMDYDYTICCAAHEMGETAPLPGIAVNRWNDWQGKAKVFYRQRGLYGDKKPQQIIGELNPSVIYINGIYSLHYNILPLLAALRHRRQGNQVGIVLSARGMLHPGALGQKALKKKLFLSWFRWMGFHRQVRWHATDAQEAEYIRSAFGKSVDVKVAGNFPKQLEVQPPLPKVAGTLVLGTIALISPMKNHLAVLQALMQVDARVEWHIWGPVKDAVYWEDCQHTMEQLPKNIRVIYHGEVDPSTTVDALRSIQVFIMPSESENFGHALMEALGAGRPVITTDTTPLKDLQAIKAGITVHYPQMEQELPAAIRQFADMEDTAYLDYCSHARKLYEQRVNREALREEYEELFGPCVVDASRAGLSVSYKW